MVYSAEKWRATRQGDEQATGSKWDLGVHDTG